MRSPRDFFKPLAVGAPEPVREIPFRPSRVIHFFPPQNEKLVSKLPDIIPTVLDRIRHHSATGQYFLLLIPEISGGTTAYIEALNVDALFPLLQKLSPRETMGEMFVFFFPDLTPEQTEEHIVSLLTPKK